MLPLPGTYVYLGVEVSHLTGRSDWEMLGKPDSPYANIKFLLEFKYAPVKGERKARLLKLQAPFEEDVAQVNRTRRIFGVNSRSSPCVSTLSTLWGARDL